MSADTQQLTRHFEETTRRFIDEARRKLDLAHARGDQDAARVEHVKIEVMRAAREIYNGAHARVHRRRAWPEGTDE